jgi:hypothetical protein
MIGATVDSDGVLQQTDLEARSSVDNLDSLQANRRALVAKRILVELDQKGEKAPSEAALERMANADIEHIAFCDKLEADFARFILLENDIADVSEQIRNREECLRCWRAELGLSR